MGVAKMCGKQEKIVLLIMPLKGFVICCVMKKQIFAIKVGVLNIPLKRKSYFSSSKPGKDHFVFSYALKISLLMKSNIFVLDKVSLTFTKVIFCGKDIKIG